MTGLADLRCERFRMRNYRGLVELTHLRTGSVVYGTTVLEAMDQLVDAWDAVRESRRPVAPMSPACQSWSPPTMSDGYARRVHALSA